MIPGLVLFPAVKQLLEGRMGISMEAGSNGVGGSDNDYVFLDAVVGRADLR